MLNSNIMLKIANIPKPSNDILQLVVDITSRDISSGDIPKNVKLVNDPNSTAWWSDHLKNEYNIIKSTILWSGRLVSMIREEYGSFLENHILNPYIVVFENTNPSIPAYYPPHVDPKRGIAFNYYVDSGGENSTLSMYNEYCPNELIDEFIVKDWVDLTLLRQYKLSSNNWYCLDTQRFHSVDYIQTKRVFITMSPMNPLEEKPIGPPTYNKETDSFASVNNMYPNIFQEY